MHKIIRVDNHTGECEFIDKFRLRSGAEDYLDELYEDGDIPIRDDQGFAKLQKGEVTYEIVKI